MYDNNPTLEGVKKEMLPDELQGDVFFKEQIASNQSGKKFYIESYGCQMNFSDSEIVAAILAEAGYAPTKNIDESDLMLINTCSIREKAEETALKRIFIFNKIKKKRPGALVGILGCMAERLKKQWLEQEKIVDIVVGPDAYRDLPNLLAGAETGQRGVNVLLSREETYSEINPVRLDSNGILGFISIMRGCDNMCSFCVVPFTRGRERSRDVFSILAEANDLYERGYREVTLLGQNVDSYKWQNPETSETVNFANLLEMVALIHPDLRVRFSTSHPKDITDEVLETIAKYENICKHIHLPVQSGSSRILELMNRTYTREWYLERVAAIRRITPECSISGDIITGFCSETEEDHKETLSIIPLANFTISYMYYYSERPGTLAARKFPDDISLETKKRRLAEVIEVQRAISHKLNKLDIGKEFKVLVEGPSKRSEEDYAGRNSQNKLVIFPRQNALIGEYVTVEITEVTSGTLIGKIKI